MRCSLSVFLFAALMLVGCGPAPALPGAPLTSLAQASTGELQVELLAKAPLQVGQNRVFYRLTESGVAVPHATLRQRPVMQMETMKHGCPVVNPGDAPNADGLFEGLLIFTMASSEMDQWTLQLELELVPGGDVTPIDLGMVVVADSAMKKVVTREGKSIVLSLGYPETPHVGANPVVISAHQASDAMKMAYAPVADLAFTLTSEMPSMGHGSAGNVNPEQCEDGLYRGTAVFSMSGDWVLHLGVSSGDEALGAFDFPIDL